jgi:hypothetical protein
MYTIINFKTAKQVKEAVNMPGGVGVYQPGPFGPDVKDGRGVIEGPHYPQPHRFYVQVEVKDGKAIKVVK